MAWYVIKGLKDSYCKCESLSPSFFIKTYFFCYCLEFACKVEADVFEIVLRHLENVT